MNSETECNCCPPVTCEECLPHYTSRPHLSFRNRAERPLKYEPDCGPKNCSIFGSHDTNPLPEYSCFEKPTKIKDENKNSLGSPIGLVASNVNFKTEGKTGDIIQARYATYLKAFARLYLNDEREWDSQLLDDIMKEGLDLYTKSQNKESMNETETTDIYMPHEEEVLREFELAGFTFHIELMPQLRITNSNSIELGAQGDGVEITLEDIIPALERFFRQHKYGLLTVATFYSMIWRTKEAYFVFDACGRRLTDFQADKQKGVAMLMCFKNLENIRYLINHLSGLQITDPLVLRELKLVKVVTPQGHIMQRDYTLRQHQYEIVNDDYAFLKTDLHLTLNKRDLLRNRSGLPVAVTAIVVSKIEHPATWNQKLVDHIICFGVHFCQAKWHKCKTVEDLHVSKFPKTFLMGQFHINLEIKDHCYQGTWRCVPGFKHSELAHAIRKAFHNKHYKLILQINCQMYAIWKKQEFIYLLDPYRHRLLGKQNETKVYEQMEKSATVRMFCSFEVFMNVLNHILLDSNRTSHFFLHSLKVKNIQTREKPGQVKSVKEPNLDDEGEIVSLNEHICFEEAEDLCKIALGEISDYEDEELKSDVDEIELRTSSSEEELLEEEGETGAGELGEMEDIETSSSGEEGMGHKKSKENKKRGKGSKGKGKEAKKPGGNRNKKGKGANDSENEGELSESKKSGKVKKSKKSKETNKDIKGEKTNQNEESEEEKDLKQEIIRRKYKKEKEDNQKDKFTKDSEKNPEGHELYIEKNQRGDKIKQNPNNQNASKDKNVSKNKDTLKPSHKNNEREPSKGQEQTRETEASKNKDQNKKQDLSNNQNLSKDKELNKPSETTNDENKSKEKNLIRGEDISTNKNLSKDNFSSLDTFEIKDKNQVQDKDLSADKQLSKDTDFIKSLIQDKIKKDFNNTQQNENKSELDKSKDHTKQETNKENEVLEALQKLNEDYDKTKDKGNTKVTTKAYKNDLLQNEIKKLGNNKPYPKQSKPNYNDGTEADDENEEFSKSKKTHLCSIPNPNCYPGYYKFPMDMAIVGSESGSYQSICKLFQAGFKAADRLLLMTPWGNFVIFRCLGQITMTTQEKHYFLFDGCTCNFDRFRHFDLSVGTAGLICFKHLHNIIEYIRHLRKSRSNKQEQLNYSAEDICKEYGNKSFNLRV